RAAPGRSDPRRRCPHGGRRADAAEPRATRPLAPAGRCHPRRPRDPPAPGGACVRAPGALRPRRRRHRFPGAFLAVGRRGEARRRPLRRSRGAHRQGDRRAGARGQRGGGGALFGGAERLEGRAYAGSRTSSEILVIPVLAALGPGRNPRAPPRPLKTTWPAGPPLQARLSVPFRSDPDETFGATAFRRVKSFAPASRCEEAAHGATVDYKFVSCLGLHELAYHAHWRNLYPSDGFWPRFPGWSAGGAVSEAYVRDLEESTARQGDDWSRRHPGAAVWLQGSCSTVSNQHPGSSRTRLQVRLLPHLRPRHQGRPAFSVARKLFKAVAGIRRRRRRRQVRERASGDAGLSTRARLRRADMLMTSPRRLRLSELKAITGGVRGGLLVPLGGQRSRINDRFFLGGATNIRGFKFCGIGPREGGAFYPFFCILRVPASAYWGGGVGRDDALGGELFVAANLSATARLNDSRGPLPLYAHAWVNGGKLVYLDKTATAAENARNLADAPAAAAGVGLACKFGNIRGEANISVPLSSSARDLPSSGFQFGFGFEFMTVIVTAPAAPNVNSF
ncbi:MAG: hypothetical protein BJ554DRAFT_3291, partial [Olpidium bornovanus]